MKEKKVILVTGGAGFIGSAVAKRLYDDGHSVVVIDNFNDYYDVTLKRAREQVFLKGVEVTEGSITDENLLREVFSNHQFDVVAHLAAQAGVRYSLENPGLYVDTNVKGTQLILEMMREFKIPRMVFASTSSVYGNDSEVPFKETHSANQPVSIYAATKKAGELLAHTYASLYDLEITCLRFFTVYGPWSRPDMALLKFTELMGKGEEIDVYNEGKLRRDWTYIDDIVDGFIKAIDKPQGYQIINLGNGNPTELLDFINILETELGVVAKKNFKPMQAGDVFETYADVSKAKELLGFEAKTSIEEGIKKFVSWYRDYHKDKMVAR